MLSKISQSQKDKHCVTALDEVPSAVKLIERKVGGGGPEAGAKAMGSLRDRVSILLGKSSEAWLVTIVNILDITELYI